MKVNVGQKFVLSLKVKDAAEYYQSAGKIFWTSGMLKFEKIEAGAFLDGAILLPGDLRTSNKQDSMTFGISKTNSENSTGSGEILKIHFSAIQSGTVNGGILNGKVQNSNQAVVDSLFNGFVLDVNSGAMNVHFFEVQIV